MSCSTRVVASMVFPAGDAARRSGSSFGVANKVNCKAYANTLRTTLAGVGNDPHIRSESVLSAVRFRTWATFAHVGHPTTLGCSTTNLPA